MREEIIERDSEGHEMLRADPAVRRAAILAVIAAIAIGVVALGYLQPLFDRARTGPATASDVAFAAVLLRTCGIATLAFGAAVDSFLALSAIRILRSGRFPPPGARVIRDTRILQGAAARRVALVHLLLGTVFLAAGFVLLILTWRLAGTVR